MPLNAISSGITASVVQPMIAARVRIKKDVGVISESSLNDGVYSPADGHEMGLRKGYGCQAFVTSLLRGFTLRRGVYGSLLCAEPVAA
jgi:hypothetical protein